MKQLNYGEIIRLTFEGLFALNFQAEIYNALMLIIDFINLLLFSLIKIKSVP